MFFRKPLSSLLLLCACALLLAAPHGVLGAETTDGVIVTGLDDCDFQTGIMTAACIPRFIGHMIQFVFGFVGMFFVINVMYGGYELALGYIGEGDKGKGKDRVKWSILGLILCTCIFLILDLVLNVVLGS